MKAGKTCKLKVVPIKLIVWELDLKKASKWEVRCTACKFQFDGIKSQFYLPLSLPDRMYDPKVVHYVIMLLYSN